MKDSVTQWLERLSTVASVGDIIDFQTAYVADLCEDNGYTTEVTQSKNYFIEWARHKEHNILTYRDQCFTSIFTGTVGSKHDVPWLEAFDDSISAVVG